MTSEASSGCSEYQELSRRHFLQAGTGLAAFLAAHAWVPRVAYAKSHRGGARDVVVSLYLRGAADGLTLCVPYADNAYYTRRPTIAIPRPDTTDTDKATDLDGRFGLPPAMAPAPPRLPGRKAPHRPRLRLHGPHPFPLRSPAASWKSESPDDPSIGTGWLGRHIATSDRWSRRRPPRRWHLDRPRTQSLIGGPDTLPIANLSGFNLAGAQTSRTARRMVIDNMYNGTVDPLKAAGLSTLATIDTLAQHHPSPPITPPGGATYPATAASATAMKTTAAHPQGSRSASRPSPSTSTAGILTPTRETSPAPWPPSCPPSPKQVLAAFDQDVVAGTAPNAHHRRDERVRPPSPRRTATSAPTTATATS